MGLSRFVTFESLYFDTLIGGGFVGQVETFGGDGATLIKGGMGIRVTYCAMGRSLGSPSLPHAKTPTQIP